LSKYAKLLKATAFVGIFLLSIAIGFGLCSLYHAFFDHGHLDYVYKHDCKETSRSPSPDKALDAMSCYTMGFRNVYYLHIIPASSRTQDFEKYPAMFVSTRPFTVDWIDSYHLAVDPGYGQVNFFSNLSIQPDGRLAELEFLYSSGQHQLKPDGNFE
jgi:hypothetical protein